MNGSTLSPLPRGLSLSRRPTLLWLVFAIPMCLLASACSDAEPPTSVTPVAVSDVGGTPYSGCTADEPLPGFVNHSGEVEPTAAVDPRDPKRIAVAWQQDRWVNGAARGIAVASSSDGGETWSSTSRTGMTPCSGRSGPGPERVTDPWLSYGADGTLHLVGLAVNRDPRAAVGANDEEVIVTRSTDGGTTWAEPQVLVKDADPDIYNDKPSVTADPTDPNLVYAVWHRLIQNGKRADGETVLARSNDGGMTWQRPQVIHGPLRGTQSFGNEILALPKGSGRSVLVNVSTLLGTGPRGADRARVAVMRSSDNGRTWSDPTIIDDLRAAPVIDPTTGSELKTGRLLTRAAADPSGAAIYVAWSDNRFASDGGNSVALTMSLDAGGSWSQPVPIDEVADAGRGATFTPEIAVTSDGALGVTYYVLRNSEGGPGSAERLMTDVFLATCVLPSAADPDRCSGGWSEERVTGHAFDLRSAPDSSGPFLGDYVGLAGAGPALVAAFPLAGDPADPSSIFVWTFTPQVEGGD